MIKSSKHAAGPLMASAFRVRQFVLESSLVSRPFVSLWLRKFDVLPAGTCNVATFLDDFSRLSVVVPVPSKAEVIPTVKKIINMLETQSGQKLRKMRTDRSAEYLNNELKDFYSAKGIVHQTTAPYTPEQNGKAERLNRTLMERVRAMLQDAKLPNSLWAEAVTTANYIRNRSPVCGDSKTPKELFYGDKPDVSNMKTFGARAYVHIPKAQRQKLDPVSIKGIMVG